MTDGEGDSEGSEADGGCSSALEDDGTQLAELARGLPPGARISPQRITPVTPAVARARWRLQQAWVVGRGRVEGCPSALVHGDPQACGPCGRISPQSVRSGTSGPNQV